MMNREEMYMTYHDIVNNWRSKNITNIPDLETALDNFSIIFAYNSGNIENPEITYHNTREIWENGQIINFTGNVRTIFEIQNQKICYEYLKAPIVRKDSVTPELIRTIHKLLTSGTYDQRRYKRGERPGEYKKHDYVIGTGDQGAPPEDVSSEIEELCDELIDIPDIGENIIKVAAYLHCKFENIHPFADGNGRVGRTLMNYYLITHNYPPLIVRTETKDIYYKALEHYDQTGEIDLFVKYIKEETCITWSSRHRENATPKASLLDILQKNKEIVAQREKITEKFHTQVER